MKRAQGFTLIEVIVALFVVALGMGALLATLTSSADSISHLRNKAFAQWIALNRIGEIRLSAARPQVGDSEGEIQYAGSAWRWRQQVSDQGVGGLLRIEVSVAPALAGSGDSTAGADAEAFPTLGSAYGFIGTAAEPPNGFEPDWSLASATGGSPQGGSGQDDSAGGGTGTTTQVQP